MRIERTCIYDEATYTRTRYDKAVRVGSAKSFQEGKWHASYASMTLPGNLSTLKIIERNTGVCVVSPVVAIRIRQRTETHEKHGVSERKSGGWIVGEK